MRLLELLWLRLTFRRRPRVRQALGARPGNAPLVYGALSPKEVAWVEAIRPLFDNRYYLHTHPEVRHGELSAPAHYVQTGWRLGHDPAPWFSDAGYLERHADVAAAGLPPFVHYALYGRNEGRAVTPAAGAPPPSGPSTEPAQISAHSPARVNEDTAKG